MQPADTAARERAVARTDSPAELITTSLSVVHPMTTESNTTSNTTGDGAFALTPPHNPGQMRVTKRNGGQEIVDVNKIVRAVTRSGEGLHGVDPLRVALKTIGGLYDGATTPELDQLSIRTAAALTAE
jgi:ribonucleoside-diphosphate reductase alpha chain